MGILDGTVDPGSIPGMDPETLKQLQAFMAMMQPSQTAVDQAKKNRIIDFGLGLMGARKGSELQAIGQSGLNAMGNYNKDLAAQQALQGQNVGQAMQLLQMAKQNQALQQNATLGKGVGDIFGGGAQTPASAPQLQNMGAGGPTPSNAAAVAPPAPAQQSPADQVRAMANQYRQAAALYAKAGPQYAAQFKQYADAANALEQQLEYATTPQTVMQDGKPVNVLVNKSGGTQVMNYGVKPDYKEVNNGQQIGFYDPIANQMAPGLFQRQQDPNSKASNALGYANLAETKRYHNLEQGMDETGQGTGNMDAVAKAIANYQQPGLSSFAMAKPMGAVIMGKVMEINPAYDAKNYATAQQTANAFAKGSQGNTVRSIGVAVQHMDVLGQAADALQNGDIPLFNKAANFVATQTGGAAPTNFNAIKQIVGNEIVKAIVGSGGGVGDRDKAQQVISAANSPEQLKSVMDSYKQLFIGQLNGLEQQYKAGTGRDDFSKFVSPEVQSIRAAKNAGATGTAPQPAGTDKQTGKPLYRRADGKLYFTP